MTPSSPTTSKRLSLMSVEWQHTLIKFKQVCTATHKEAGLWKNAFTQPCLTLWNYFKKFRVGDDLTVLHLWHIIRFLGLTPEVGASVHAGYVEDSYALQRHAAQVQRSPTTLGEVNQQVVCTHSWTKAMPGTLTIIWIRYVFGAEIPTSIERQSFSFLQEAEMVSDVANSKYQSLFFILRKQQRKLLIQ